MVLPMLSAKEFRKSRNRLLKQEREAAKLIEGSLCEKWSISMFFANILDEKN